MNGATTPSVEDFQIAVCFGVVAGEAVTGAYIKCDLFGGATAIFGGRSGAYGQQLGQARKAALREIEERVRDKGENTAVGVDLDHEVINNMLMVAASGTAVRLA